MEKYMNLIDRFKGKRILVLGDFILDEYIYGETERISREAPVLILKYRQSTYLAGGGANPILNIKDIGAEPIPVSLVGDDGFSDILLDIINRKKVETKYILRDEKYMLPVKTRIMAGSVHTAKQQVVRVDKYHIRQLSGDIEKQIIVNIKKLAEETDAILVSDYGGGIITDAMIEVINGFGKKGKKVIVDSRHNLFKFRHIATGTPNETEAGPLVNIEEYEEEDVKKIGFELMKLVKSKGMIITRGSKGMLVFEKKNVEKIKAYGSDEIVDVSGAGDTVSSIVAAGLACGASLYDSAYLANIGGGIVVMKRGVATVSPDELKEALKNVKA
jgi:rfaE bifunctional protein kinase chain/domain